MYNSNYDDIVHIYTHSVQFITVATCQLSLFVLPLEQIK